MANPKDPRIVVVLKDSNTHAEFHRKIFNDLNDFKNNGFGDVFGTRATCDMWIYDYDVYEAIRRGVIRDGPEYHQEIRNVPIAGVVAHVLILAAPDAILCPGQRQPPVVTNIQIRIDPVDPNSKVYVYCNLGTISGIRRDGRANEMIADRRDLTFRYTAPRSMAARAAATHILILFYYKGAFEYKLIRPILAP